MQTLALDARSIELILTGDRTWQFCYAPLEKASGQLLELVQGCSDLVMGQVEVASCIGPITRSIFEDNLDKLNLTHNELQDANARLDEGGIYAIIISNSKRYQNPFPLIEDMQKAV